MRPVKTSVAAAPARVLYAACPVLATLLWFALLAERPLYDPDEGRYAEIAREMVVGGDWIIPHLDGLVYLEKPPLQYWLIASSFRMFGQGEFVARLSTGVAGYLLLLMVGFVGRRLWNLRAGLQAAALTGASALFVLLGHQLTLDMALSCCLTGSLACFLMAEFATAARARDAPAWMLGCWASMALAVLTKGLIGVLIPAATLIGYAAWQRDMQVLRRLQWRWGLPLFALMVLPWFVEAARREPVFLRFFFVREHFQRFLTPIEHRSEPWWFFVPVLCIGILPWLPQALRALALPLRASAPRVFDPARVLWVWSAFVLVFFSLSDAKLIPYILPAVPALALLCSAPATSRDIRRDLFLGSLLTVAACAGLGVYLSGIYSAGAARELARQLAPDLAGTALLLAAAGAGGLLLASRDRYDGALVMLCGGWFFASLSVLAAANGVERFFSSKDAARLLESHASAHAPVFSVQTYEQSLAFYLQRTVVLVDYRDEFSLGLGERPDQGIATLDQFSARWRSLHDAYALMPRRTRAELTSQGLPLREIAHFQNNVVVSRR